MDLIEYAIKNDDITKVDKYLEKKHIDDTFGNGITPLIFSITGSTKHKKEFYEKGNFNIMTYLLYKEANPRTRSIIAPPPIFHAVSERKIDMVIFLLFYKASANDFGVERIHGLENNKVNTMNNKKAICKFPLEIAVENLDCDMVELLITNGAIYNKYSISKVKTLLENYKLKKDIVDDNNKFVMYYKKCNKLEKIVNIMEENYNEKTDEKVNEFLSNNTLLFNYKIKTHFEWLKKMD